MAKKIENEIKEAETKKETILNETDINETNIEAETITEMKVKVFNKEYKLTELIELTRKEHRSYEENEIVKKFKLLMKNYYEGIKYAALMQCCGRIYTLRDLKKKLEKEETYRIIELRCSRNNLKFDKNTVDIVMKFAEEYKLCN